MRGPKIKVTSATKRKSGQSMTWQCNLACGHKVERPIKRRRVGPGHAPEDHAPDWVYCEDCRD